jgi:hypothetical protein
MRKSLNRFAVPIIACVEIPQYEIAFSEAHVAIVAVLIVDLYIFSMGSSTLMTSHAHSLVKGACKTLFPMRRNVKADQRRSDIGMLALV